MPTITPSAAAADISCPEPAPDQAPHQSDPQQVDDALRFGVQAKATAIQIYRHGCLAGEYGPAGNAPLPLFSASKGVASVAVGRAVTLGYFRVDDPIGRFFPQADADHARITVRQILTQSSGLHFSWPADTAAIGTSSVGQALASPAQFEPGTTFQYAQNVLALLPKIIEITTGTDFQDFVQKQVMEPIGIPRGNWVWLRTRDGVTAVDGGLAMRPADLARIGRLLLQQGSWNGRELIDPDYIREATTPTQANGGYGFLWWLNAGPTFRGVEVPRAVHYPHRLFAGLPHDAYAFSGALGQFVVVVPSRDMVIVRLGVPATFDPSNVTAFLTGTSNPDNRMLFYRSVAALTSQPEPLDDPDIPPDPHEQLGATPQERELLADPQNTLAVLLGTGPYASTDCNVAICDGRPLPADVFAGMLDALAQVAAVIAALPNPPR